jgi:hypothetical protein
MIYELLLSQLITKLQTFVGKVGYEEVCCTVRILSFKVSLAEMINFNNRFTTH